MKKPLIPKSVRQFMRGLDPERTVAMLKTLLNTLPDVSFVMKDRNGRFMALNERNVSVAGFKSEAEMLGKTSACYLSPNFSDEYTRGEHEVMETGEPILNLVSPSPDRSTRNALISVNDYILWTRINRARDLLEHTALRISDIATEVGFCDHSHFIRTFKRLRGITPRQHRLQHQQKTAP